ncbi:hypothetical protein [Mucilaginibacter defluvii]|uniref:Uncharacterized protein n=1 Tax=Mucilaginibacter defluvii TaxID=1196019 RepID=A0ABP9FJN4_9SPHI
MLAVVAGLVTERLTAKVKLTRNDYYGEYVIGRAFFPGIWADWQYNSFRFEIKKNDSVYFFVTDKERLIKTYKGKISTVNPYGSERLIIQMDKPGHHVLNANPTVYRSRTGFYLVFNSPRYKNMFFIKAKWKRLPD